VGAKLALEVNSADITSKPVHDSQVVVMFHQEKQVTFCVQYKVLMSTLVGLSYHFLKGWGVTSQ
jgi:hypothetical protein